jgi:hypothetical protein
VISRKTVEPGIVRLKSRTAALSNVALLNLFKNGVAFMDRHNVKFMVPISLYYSLPAVLNSPLHIVANTQQQQ